MRHRLFDTPTGVFALVEHNDGRIMTSWLTPEVELMLSVSRPARNLLPDLSRRLTRYFGGHAVDFSDVPLPPAGGFFMRCWEACRSIPRGQTRSYAELAAMAGSPHAARAAGQAMRNNLLPIIIPCHRVIGSDGRLHGFGGSMSLRGQELAIKRRLLMMEGALAASPGGLWSDRDSADETLAKPHWRRSMSRSVA